MADYRAPGVYIEELPATGPISGVGTSTAAFVGAAQRGDIGVATRIGNWTQFSDAFGAYLAAPRSYLAHAVRGFFENGGTTAYVVRVGTATRAALDLADHGGGTALIVRAAAEGPAGNGLTVAVQDAQIVTGGAGGARVRRASAPIVSAEGDVVRLQNAADAAAFAAGDVVTVEGGTERAQITRIQGAQLVLGSRLATSAAAGTVRIADLAADQRSFRVENGGGIERGSVLRLRQGAQEETAVVDAVSGDSVTLAAGLANGYSLEPADSVELSTTEFTLLVAGPGGNERFGELSMDPRHSRYVVRAVTGSTLVRMALPDPPSAAAPGDNRPAEIDATALAGGTADDPAAVGPDECAAALAVLEKVDDVSIVCVPGRTEPAVQQAVIAHCEKTKDRFAVLDPAPRAAPFGDDSVLTQRAGVESSRGYAALYYPWLRVSDPGDAAQTVLVPPSGHVAGVFARSDAERGVHKAPANELLSGALGLERVLDDGEQGDLNVEGVNVLRVFPGRARPVIWGARTTAPKDATAWRYVNVRRLFLYLEESIEEGIRWAVFEPNDLSLWKKLDRTITEFLTRIWGSGALFGTTPAEAFYVKIDSENNPQSVRDLGRIVIEIGVAPVRPAEFVVVRIGVWPGGTQVEEG